MVGPGLASSLRGGTLRADVVTRIRILADRRAHVRLVGPNRAGRVVGLPRPGDIVTIPCVKAAHLSGAWLVGPGVTGSRRGGFGRIDKVSLLCFGAFGHPIRGLVCSSRARGLATSTRCGSFDIESWLCIYACLDSRGGLIGVELAWQALRLTG